MGAIRREMNSAKWTWFAIGYECGFAYVIALMITQFGNLFTGRLTGALNVVSFIAAVGLLAFGVYLLFFKKYREAATLEKEIRV